MCKDPRNTRSLALLLVLVLFSIAAAPAPKPTPSVTFELLNPLPGSLALGESYTIDIRITSDTAFLFATAMPAPQYPGKFVVFNGSSRAGHGTTAVLRLTLTAKDPSMALFPEGVPTSFAVGVRFKGGVTASEWYQFNVIVP